MSPTLIPFMHEVLAHLKTAGVRPGISTAHYEAPADDGSVMLRVGSGLGGEELAESARVRVVELPMVEVASVVRQGTMHGIAGALDALMR